MSSSSSSSSSSHGAKHCGKHARSEKQDSDDGDTAHPTDNRSLHRSLKRMRTRLVQMSHETKSAESAYVTAIADEKALKRKCDVTSVQCKMLDQDEVFIAARGDKYRKCTPSARIFDARKRLDALCKAMIASPPPDELYLSSDDDDRDAAGGAADVEQKYTADASMNDDYCNFCGEYGRNRHVSNQLGVLVTEIRMHRHPTIGYAVKWFAYNVDYAYSRNEKQRVTLHNICSDCCTRWKQWHQIPIAAFLCPFMSSDEHRSLDARRHVQ